MFPHLLGCDGCDFCSNCPVHGVSYCWDHPERTRFSDGGNLTLKNLYVEPGYWRPDNQSLKISPCFNPEACPGGRGGNCKQGYNGLGENDLKPDVGDAWPWAGSRFSHWFFHVCRNIEGGPSPSPDRRWEVDPFRVKHSLQFARKENEALGSSLPVRHCLPCCRESSFSQYFTS